MIPHHEFLGSSELWAIAEDSSGRRSRDSPAMIKPRFDVMLGPRGELLTGSNAAVSHHRSAARRFSRSKPFGPNAGGARGQSKIADSSYAASLRSTPLGTWRSGGNADIMGDGTGVGVCWGDGYRVSLPHFNNNELRHSSSNYSHSIDNLSSNRKSSFASTRYFSPSDNLHDSPAQRAQQLDQWSMMMRAKAEMLSPAGKRSSASSMDAASERINPTMQLVLPGIKIGSAGHENVLGIEFTHKSTRGAQALTGITKEYFPEEWKGSRKSRNMSVFRGTPVYTANSQGTKGGSSVNGSGEKK